MELPEKIQKLRKERGLTQEQFAEQLFVSRTAVSKWETGRGTPSMESLQMIAKLYGATLDELLRAEEILTIAEKENKENISRFASYMDGIFNVAALTGVLLPLYKAEQNGMFYSVPLYQFHEWSAAYYWALSAAMMLCGIIQIAIHQSDRAILKCGFGIAGAAVNVLLVLLMILNGQPYPAVMFFALLLIKGAAMAPKRR